MNNSMHIIIYITSVSSCTDLSPKVSGRDGVSGHVCSPQLHALVGTPD